LKNDSKSIGALTIYASEPDAFDRRETELLKELANDLSYGITTLRLQEDHQKMETTLLESYKHLGVINRQISILLELNKRSGGKNTQEILSFVMNSLQNVTQAQVVGFYNYIEKEKSFTLIASLGMKQEMSSKMDILDCSQLTFLSHLIKKKSRVQLDIERDETKILGIRSNLRYILFVPLIINRKAEGALFIGFSNRDFITTQELEFYDAFAAQTSFVLQNFDISLPDK
jgi:GAF domain-containing protein